VLKEDLKDKSWIDNELKGCKFKDLRLEKRFNKLLSNLSDGIGETIPYACQDWANTKAAYRFFDNEKISEYELLSGHFQSTQTRFKFTDDPILILHDTTEFSYKRNEPELIGSTRIVCNGRKAYGQLKRHTRCGLLMHSSLVVTPEGLPLGLAAIKFWTRDKFKGCNALKKHINTTRIPIEQKESIRWLENLKQSTDLLAEPQRCIHIGDRESDIYELFCAAKEKNTHFLVRICADRLTGIGDHTISDEVKEVAVKGLHRIKITDKKGKISHAILNLKYKRIKVLPPVDKKKKYPELTLTVIDAKESKKSKNRESIHWKLMTDLPIKSCKDVIEKLNWYAMRWKIEIFHKILKSGCKVESAKLRTAERLTKLISVFCIVSWRIFWITMLNRCMPTSSPRFALTENEIKLLDQLTNHNKNDSINKRALPYYLTCIARLGGYLARASDPPPGNIVIWRGLSRLTDITLGFNLALKIVGN
jgi:hypothetical protein